MHYMELYAAGECQSMAYSHNDDHYMAVEVCDCDAGTKCHDDSTHGSDGILCEHNDDVTKTMLRR